MAQKKIKAPLEFLFDSIPAGVRYRLMDEVVVPVAKIAITSGLFAIGNKIFRRATNTSSKDAVGDIVRERLISVAVDSVTSKILDKGRGEDLSAIGRVIAKHLGAPRWYEEGIDVPSWQKTVLAVSLRRFLDSDCEVVRMMGVDDKREPVMDTVVTGYNKTESCCMVGYFLVIYKGQRLVVEMDLGKSWRRINIHGEDRVAVDVFIADFKDYSVKNNYLKGLAIDSEGELIWKADCPRWEDIVIRDPLKQKILKNTIGFLKNYDEFEANGITHRGCLWVGDAGTGKTSVAKIIAGECIGKATYISVSAPSLGSGDQETSVRDVFRWARNLSPCVVLLDDLDRAGETVANQLLGEMDGAHPNDGVVVIATVNDISVLDLALRNRPNRFDAVFEFVLPEEGERRELVALFSKDFDLLDIVTGESVDKVVEMTEGLSPSHIEECFRNARIQGIDIIQSVQEIRDQNDWMLSVDKKKDRE